MKILAGDITDARTSFLSAFSGRNSRPLSLEFIRLAAEYFYDFGDILRSAELFSMLPDEESLSRQADALWLAGYADNARNIWAILSQYKGSARQNRARYNLALTSFTQEEKIEQLEFLSGETDIIDQYNQFATVNYSRMMDVSAALAFLDTRQSQNPNSSFIIPHSSLTVNTLLELEKLKRRTENVETARIIAEIWMLLDRYPLAEDLYQWGAWYFDLQRNYNESALLVRAAARQNFTGQWREIHEALQLVREGRLDAAEEKFSLLLENQNNWTAAANLGRIHEANRAPLRALECYKKAFDSLMESGETHACNTTASRILVRIALCHKTLGSLSESRRSLENAIELNPDNINARFELSRL
jgi:tetratricopeptide (TPR) repeat protein